LRYDFRTVPKLHARPTHDKELSSDHRSKAAIWGLEPRGGS